MYKIVATAKSTIKKVGAGTLSREFSSVDEPKVEDLRVIRRDVEKQYKELYGGHGTADITVRRA